MPVPTVKVDAKTGQITLSAPLANPETSKSGKMNLFMQTGGFIPTGQNDPATGKPIMMNVSVGVSTK